jgi:pteridine reductase
VNSGFQFGGGVDGRTVLVTGAARRVGSAIARTLHAAGASIMLHYRSARTDAEALAAELDARRPGSVACVQADLLDIEQLPRLIADTRTRFGRLDALVNNASSFFPTPLGTITPAHWDDLVGSNLKAPLFLTQAAAPLLRATRGAVVNITDIHAERPLAGYPLYCAAKAGLLGLTRALAIELAPEVRVNAVAPGPIPTENFIDSMKMHTPEREAELKEYIKLPLERWGTPEDIGAAVLYMVSPASGWVTGQCLYVTGGS